MDKSIRLDHPTLGVCYYPEHWPQELWADDIDRMLQHGIELVRIGEFAWNKIEPQEGEYSFCFFDSFIDLCAKKGMKVIFCTPSATPPAWLSVKYPSVLNADIDGVKYRHGQRRHYNYNSRLYRRMVSTIVQKIAQHYGRSETVIGWQIDNELNCEMAWFRSLPDHEAFRLYLQQKFGSLDALNEAIGATFWNQTYTNWSEVYLASPTVSNSPNPHLLLEEIRFVSESAISFCQMQADILRRHAREGQFITTNGIFPHLDSHKMTEKALDFISFDNYPNFCFAPGEGINKAASDMLDRGVGLNLSRARAISKNFCIMEQQSGPQGWNSRMEGPSPKPGQMRLWALQGVAHGADMVSFFRWRTAPYGTEIYWHGLLNYDNLPNRRMQELMRLKQDFEALHDLGGARYEAPIAMIRDYDNEWDGEIDRWHGPMREASERAWFAAAQKAHVPMDLLYLWQGTQIEALLRYELIVYPHATILTDEVAALLRAYVEAGGQLILGPRTGYKDEMGRCPMRPMPGPARELVGARVEDFTMIGPQDAPEYILWGGERLECPTWCDILIPEGAEALASYHGNYFSGQTAIVKNQLGKGAAYYYGGGFSEQAASVLLRKLEVSQPYADLLELPPELELAIREKGGQRWAFILNYQNQEHSFTLREPRPELLGAKPISGAVALEPYGVMAIKLS